MGLGGTHWLTGGGGEEVWDVEQSERVEGGTGNGICSVKKI